MKPIHRISSIAAAAVIVAAAAPARAQTPIRVGETVSGQLTEKDPRISATDSSYYKPYVFHARAGDAVKITMRSSAFDSFLSVGRLENGAWRTRRFDDDGAGGNDSQLNWVVPEEGDWTIRANSVSVSTGPFTLSLEQGTPPGPVVNHAISMGQTVSGTLSDRSPQESDGTYYEQYTFRGQAGQTVQVTQRSKDFDSYLNFGRVNGGEFSSLKTNDDGAGGNDSRILITLPSDGDYAIHANSLSRATGGYTLTLEPGTPPPPVTSTEIRSGQAVAGTLDVNDPKDTDDSSFDQYVYHGRAGERLTITMRSSAFDSYLHFGRLLNGAYSETQTDDDSAGGNDAQISVTLPETGDYAIRANSLLASASGSYTLTVTSGAGASGKAAVASKP
jgi:hypothetical protein